MRIDRDEMLMIIAHVVAQRSTCLRLKVGAVIARDGRVISTGYNGSPSGLPHCDHTTCGPEHPCVDTVHAEAGAISFAARYGVSLERSSLYLTHSPCFECAKLIINSGIEEVIFYEEYRSLKGLELLELANVSVRLSKRMGCD